MIDLNRTGAGKRLLRQVSAQNSSMVKQWTTQHKEETQKTQKNCIGIPPKPDSK